jgi:hypothetical protein
MGTKRSFVELIHDEGYGHDLIRHMNTALRGKDMIAQTAYDADEKGMQYKCPSCKIPIRLGQHSITIDKERIKAEP